MRQFAGVSTLRGKAAWGEMLDVALRDVDTLQADPLELSAVDGHGVELRRLAGDDIRAAHARSVCYAP